MSVHICVLFQGMSEKLSEQELEFRRRSQEQVDNFTLDINTAYARLRGIEQAVQSEFPFIYSVLPCTVSQDNFLRE